MNLLKRLVLVSAFLFSASAMAQPGVFSITVNKPMTAIYNDVYTSLEDAGFYVVFEPNIGKNLAQFAKKWGADYNKNKLTGLRSMVFCNGWYANQVSNLDPMMLGFCPLHLSLIERKGKTTILFNRLSVFARGSKAQPLFKKIESEVITAIKAGLK